MSKTPKKFFIGIKAIIISNGKALILKRKRDNGEIFWDIPGGRINDSEDVAQTLERELREEILNIKDYKVSKLLNAFNTNRNLDNDTGLFLIIYKVETGLTTVELSDEHFEYKWITLEDIDQILKEEIEFETGYVDAIKLALN